MKEKKEKLLKTIGLSVLTAIICWCAVVVTPLITVKLQLNVKNFKESGVFLSTGLSVNNYFEDDSELCDSGIGFNNKNTNSKEAIQVAYINLAWYNKSETPDIYFINQTSFKISAKEYLNKSYITQPQTSDGPLVLVYHTHGSEAYANDDFYFETDTFRSENPKETVIEVGKRFSAELEALGVNVIHDTKIHDSDFSKSYSSSAASIKEYLEKYPSICYIIDIHRDSIAGDDNKYLKTLTEHNNINTAQIMLVVGTNEGGGNHPNWKNNLTQAVKLQEIYNEKFPTLSRPINVRSATFNQQYSPNALLLEIGSCGNTIDEAKAAAVLAAQGFAELIFLNKK